MMVELAGIVVIVAVSLGVRKLIHRLIAERCPRCGLELGDGRHVCQGPPPPPPRPEPELLPPPPKEQDPYG